MSYVIAGPDSVAAAAGDLAALGSTIEAAGAAALAPTTQIQEAAADEVSMAISALFGTHAQEFQAVAARASTFHQQFVQALSGAAASYGATEAASAAALAAAASPAAGVQIGTSAHRRRRKLFPYLR